MPDSETTTQHDGELAPLFTIGTQEMSSQYNPDGPPVETWRVNFTTRSDTKAWIDIPARSYSAENVAQQVTTLATEIEGVHKLNA